MTLAEMWSRRLLIVSIYGLGQVAPTRANNCLDTFPAVLNEQASLEEFFYSVFVFGTLLLGISNERPLSRSENTAREHWILDKFMSFTENHESVTFVGTALKIFCSLQCFCCDIYLVINHIAQEIGELVNVLVINLDSNLRSDVGLRPDIWSGIKMKKGQFLNRSRIKWTQRNFCKIEIIQ